VAKVAVVSRATGETMQKFGDLPAGSTETYRVNLASNTSLSAWPVEPDGITACGGTWDSMRLVTKRKLAAAD
jgi:hypothetical protein